MSSKMLFSSASFMQVVMAVSLYTVSTKLLHQPLALSEPSEFLECPNLNSYTIAVPHKGITLASVTYK